MKIILFVVIFTCGKIGRLIAIDNESGLESSTEMSTIPSNSEEMTTMTTVEEVESVEVSNEYEYEENKVNDSLENDYPVEAVLNPRARIYMGPNKTGSYEDYNSDLKENPKCSYIDIENNRIGSIDTFGTCVRLYINSDFCMGPSVAFYPTLNETESDLKSRFIKEALSIGPCFENELEPITTQVHGRPNTTIINGSYYFTKRVDHNEEPYIPDLFFFGGRQQDNHLGTSPILIYRTDPRAKSRVMYLRALLKLTDVIESDRQGRLEVTLEDKKFYERLEREEGDQLGHFVGPSLGPQANLPFHNIFPQSSRNLDLMKEVEEEIVEWLKDPENSNKWIYLDINMDYGNVVERSLTTRPRGLGIKMNFFNEKIMIKYLSNLL